MADEKEIVNSPPPNNVLNDEERYKELLNNNGLSKDNLLIPAVYKEIFLDNYRYFILSSGRVSGKTSITVATIPDTPRSSEVKSSFRFESQIFVRMYP